MTVWKEVVLRQHGSAWPGLNTDGGKLDDGTGLLEDGSVNVFINEADTLQKRKGLIRGMNEWFTGVVCGLHKYTDNCGSEWLLVADESGISIRQPFVIPVFTQSDAYPFDDFAEAGAPDQLNWRNTTDYTVASAALTRTGSEISSPVRTSWMRWFKEAGNLSYQVRIEYSITGDGFAAILIKGNGDLLTGSFLRAEVRRSGTAYTASIYLQPEIGEETQIAMLDVSGLLTNVSGFLTLKYQRTVAESIYQPTIEVVPTGGALQTKSAESLTVVRDSALGQISAIACSSGASIAVVDGGPI
jgi:hypothetical protein